MRTPLLPAALVASGLLLSGCGTGLQAQTYTTERELRGYTNTTVGDLQVRNLALAPPPTGTSYKAGDHATLTGVVVNEGDAADTLTGLESTAATTITLNGGSVTVPSKGLAGSWTADVVLKQDVKVAQYVPVVLVFSGAGRTGELQVPVTSGDNALDSREPAQDPYTSGGE